MIPLVIWKRINGVITIHLPGQGTMTFTRKIACGAVVAMTFLGACDDWARTAVVEACGKACADTGMQSIGPDGCVCKPKVRP